MIQHTRLGKAMRASSQDLDASYLMGINVNRIISATFAIGSALAAAGGVMVGVYYHAVWPYMGMMAGLKALLQRYWELAQFPGHGWRYYVRSAGNYGGSIYFPFL